MNEYLLFWVVLGANQLVTTGLNTDYDLAVIFMKGAGREIFKLQHTVAAWTVQDTNWWNNRFDRTNWNEPVY